MIAFCLTLPSRDNLNAKWYAVQCCGYVHDITREMRSYIISYQSDTKIKPVDNFYDLLDFLFDMNSLRDSQALCCISCCLKILHA